MGSSTSKESAGWHPSTGSEPRRTSALGFDVTPMTSAERDAAAASLSRESRRVCLSAGTERPFSGAAANGYPHDHKGDGVWTCALGGLPLFDSATKFDSGTGWPSFYAPIDKHHVVEIKDSSIPFMSRVEVVCARSGAHLGHVFTDGPRPTGLRYCMNAAALNFVPRKDFDAQQGKS